MGMGTSTMAELGVKNNLNKLNIAANVQHTSLGQMESLRSWADIIVILKNLFSEITVKEGEFIIPVAVSYTHLDVYKRQMQRLLPVLLTARYPALYIWRIWDVLPSRKL